MPRKPLHKSAFERAREATTSRDILLFLIAFRILNALSIKTFFQPDEYFQSLEPAWEMAFGVDSGAWITWEWKNQLRSSIHPALFASVYRLSSFLSYILKLSPDSRAELLIAAPKLLQAVFAAVGDYCTWKLGERIYGKGSNQAWAALVLTICSPWQWFCSTRTLSNCLETTLTIAALSLWPWQWSSNGVDHRSGEKAGFQNEAAESFAKELAKLRCCLLLAALACVLRPTNILVWICIALFTLFGTPSLSTRAPFREANPSSWPITALSPPSTQARKILLFREAVICGSIILIVSALSDRLYYHTWTFPPVRFLYYNLAQSLAVLYGTSPWHYYLVQGYPLLLTTALPFAVAGLYQSLSISQPHARGSSITKAQLALTTLLVPLPLSLISHKEVRFIYPLLPSMHILAASPLSTFFLPRISQSRKRLSLLSAFLLAANILLALLATTAHQPAPLSVLAFLRSQHPSRPASLAFPSLEPTMTTTITVGFLMPCHSTPWRSHLVHADIRAWALTCEPPLHIPPGPQRAAYRDEADRFYADPIAFLAETMEDPPPFLSLRPHSSFQTIATAAAVSSRPEAEEAEASPSQNWVPETKNAPRSERPPTKETTMKKKPWPQHLVFFGQLEPVLRAVLEGNGTTTATGTGTGAYRECWRGWNGWGNEDWRRRGGVVVWCLSR